MVDGNKIISLGDQFKVILKRTGIEKSDNGQEEVVAEFRTIC